MLSFTNLSSTINLYELMEEIERTAEADHYQYQNVRAFFAAESMEETSLAYGYEETTYKHLLLITQTFKKLTDVLDDVFLAAEESNYLTDFPYVSYLYEREHHLEIHIIINDVSKEGDLLISRNEYFDDFLEILEERLQEE